MVPLKRQQMRTIFGEHVIQNSQWKIDEPFQRHSIVVPLFCKKPWHNQTKQPNARDGQKVANIVALPIYTLLFADVIYQYKKRHSMHY